MFYVELQTYMISAYRVDIVVNAQYFKWYFNELFVKEDAFIQLLF